MSGENTPWGGSGLGSGVTDGKVFWGKPEKIEKIDRMKA